MADNSTFPPSFTPLPSPQDHHGDPDNPYGYIPTLWICIMFIVLYSISTTIHLTQSILYRMWFMIPSACFGGMLEVLGWSARVWSHKNVDLSAPFTIQITACIIGPTPLLAANFVIFGRISRRLGIEYSRISPKWWTIFFLSCDVVALVVQSVGGAMASTASTPQKAETGGNIVLGGIAFQLAIIVVFSSCALEYGYRYFNDKPLHGKPKLDARPLLDNRLKLMLCALGFNTLCLLIRAIYRTIELSDGWRGRIIQTQVYFDVLDGGMVTLAIFTLNFLHPGFLLGHFDPSEQLTMKGLQGSASTSRTQGA